jgi:hypothetical protein
MSDGERLRALLRERRRRHRRANLTFLLAGVGFGSAAYLARTRPLSGRMGMWLAVVAAGIAVFGLAAWLQKRASRLDEEVRALQEEEREAREARKGGDGADRG